MLLRKIQIINTTIAISKVSAFFLFFFLKIILYARIKSKIENPWEKSSGRFLLCLPFGFNKLKHVLTKNLQGSTNVLIYNVFNEQVLFPYDGFIDFRNKPKITTDSLSNDLIDFIDSNVSSASSSRANSATRRNTLDTLSSDEEFIRPMSKTRWVVLIHL